MCAFIFIFLLATFITQQTDGTKVKNTMLTASAYDDQDTNIYNRYHDRAEQDTDDEKDFKDVTRYEEDKYEDAEHEYDSRRLFEWYSRLFQSTTPRADAVTTTESVYSRELKERIFLKALHRNLTHILVKLSDIEKHVSYAMDQKDAYAILTKGKPKLLSNGFYFGDRRKRESNKTAEGDRKKKDNNIDAEHVDENKKDGIKATAEVDRKNTDIKIAAKDSGRKKDSDGAAAAGDRKEKGSDKAAANGDRKKRDNKIAAEDDTRKEVTKMATADGHKRKRETDKATEEPAKAVTDKSKEDVNLNTTECPCNVTSGRRLGSMATPTEVKNKLLLYLQESFQEIKGKITSLRNLKQSFADNLSFKIGYILANIDTLEVSMLNLKNNMDQNKDLWHDDKILELYDTLKVSNQAVSGLIDLLKTYMEKLSYGHANPQLNLG